ncbi:MAG: LysR family transcriptional regulator [Alphaproteobacteria bacterium]
MPKAVAAKTNSRAPSELTIRSLRFFVAVIETGSVASAATRMNTSASAVSQQISALEQTVGADLMSRRSRPVILTPAGQILLGHAHKILQAYADAQTELTALDLVTLPELGLAVINDLDASLVPKMVMCLQQIFPGCFINTSSGRSDLVVERLEGRKVDIGITAVKPEDPNAFRSIPLVRETYVLVAAKGLIDPSEDIREQLGEAPLVQYAETMPIGRAVAQQLKRVRFNAPRKYAFEASRSVISMVVEANGWTLTTPFNLLDAERFANQVDVFSMPFPAMSRHVYLVSRFGRLGSAPDTLADECRKIISAELIPRFQKIAPHLADAIEIVKE